MSIVDEILLLWGLCIGAYPIALAITGVVLFRRRQDRHPQVEPLDFDDPRVPESVRMFLPEQAAAFSNLGFDLAGFVMVSTSKMRLRSYNGLLVDSDHATIALVRATVEYKTPKVTLFQYFCAVSSNYEDGCCLVVSNADRMGSLPAPRPLREVRIPHMIDLGELREMHDALSREIDSTRVLMPNAHDTVRGFEDLIEWTYSHWIGCGYLHECQDGTSMYLTVRGALRAVFNGVWPFSQWHKWRLRRRARALFKQHGRSPSYEKIDYVKSLAERNAPRPMPAGSGKLVARPAAIPQARPAAGAGPRYAIWRLPALSKMMARVFIVAAALAFAAIDEMPFPVLGLQSADGAFKSYEGMTRPEINLLASLGTEEVTSVRRRDWDDFIPRMIGGMIVLLIFVYVIVWLVKLLTRLTVSPFVDFPESYFLTAIALVLICVAVLRLPLQILAGWDIQIPQFLRHAPGDLLFWIVLLTSTVAYVRIYAQLNAEAARRCAGCGYLLVGAIGTRCPECGREAGSLIFAATPADADTARSPDPSQQIDG